MSAHLNQDSIPAAILKDAPIGGMRLAGRSVEPLRIVRRQLRDVPAAYPQAGKSGQAASL
jgi:hypothetical protein